jgi:hypothetical protein
MDVFFLPQQEIQGPSVHLILLNLFLSVFKLRFLQVGPRGCRESLISLIFSRFAQTCSISLDFPKRPGGNIDTQESDTPGNVDQSPGSADTRARAETPLSPINILSPPRQIVPEDIGNTTESMNLLSEATAVQGESQPRQNISSFSSSSTTRENSFFSDERWRYASSAMRNGAKPREPVPLHNHFVEGAKRDTSSNRTTGNNHLRPPDRHHHSAPLISARQSSSGVGRQMDSATAVLGQRIAENTPPSEGVSERVANPSPEASSSSSTMRPPSTIQTSTQQQDYEVNSSQGSSTCCLGPPRSFRPAPLLMCFYTFKRI